MPDTHKLPVQQFLRTHSPRELLAAHGVHVNPSADGRVVSVSYDQILAKKSDPLVLECRGLVLHLHDGTFDPDRPLGVTQILARPFRRFFNHGEGGPEHQLDLTNPEVTYENKEDGTLIIVYHDPYANYCAGGWQVATRSVPRGDQKASRLGGDTTFRDLFLRALGVDDLDRWAKDRDLDGITRLSGRCTYLFELTTPLNEVFVRQDKFRVTLLGVRDRETGYEANPVKCAERVGVPTPRQFQFANAAEAFAFIHSQPPQEHEGMVAKRRVGEGYHRAKIKNAAYVAASHVQGGNGAINSPRSLMTLILTGAFGDVESTLNAHTAEVGRQMEAALATYCQEQDAAYDRLFVPGMSRKDLAIAMGTAGLNVPACFARYEGKVPNYAGYIQSQRQADGWKDGVLDHLIRACGVKA